MTNANFNKLSVSEIRNKVVDPFYYSDDLVIAYINRRNAPLVATQFDGFVAMIVMQGTARVTLGTETYDLKPNMLVYIHSDSVLRRVECSHDVGAYLVAFSHKFISDVPVDISTSLPVYLRLGKSPCIELTDADVAEIRQLFGLIKTMLRSDKEIHKSSIIQTLFTTVFYILSDINQRRELRTKQGRCEVIFEQFTQLLQEHHKRERNVGFYAEQMNITPKYLSSVIKEISGKTAARWIDEYVILEAKTLLKYSGMSIQEIANALNFSTQSFFGKYFKQHTGYSPSRFKRQG